MSIEDVVTATVAGTEVVIAVGTDAANAAEAEALIAAGVQVATVAGTEVAIAVQIDAAEAEALIAVRVATVAAVVMEGVNVGTSEAVTGYEMEIVIGAAEFEAGPTERHSCCMEQALGLQDKFEKHRDNLVCWRKEVSEAWLGWRLVGWEGWEERLMLLTRQGSKSQSYPDLSRV